MHYVSNMEDYKQYVGPMQWNHWIADSAETLKIRHSAAAHTIYRPHSFRCHHREPGDKATCSREYPHWPALVIICLLTLANHNVIIIIIEYYLLQKYVRAITIKISTWQYGIIVSLYPFKSQSFPLYYSSKALKVTNYPEAQCQCPLLLLAI